GARALTRAQIETIRRWVDAGAPQGEPADLPALPPASSPRLRHPDFVARMRQPFSIPAEGPDLYRCFVIPLGLSATRYADAIEFHPGNTKVVHHALFFFDRSGVARTLEAEPGTG